MPRKRRCGLIWAVQHRCAIAIKDQGGRRKEEKNGEMDDKMTVIDKEGANMMIFVLE